MALTLLLSLITTLKVMHVSGNTSGATPTPLLLGNATGATPTPDLLGNATGATPTPLLLSPNSSLMLQDTR